MKAFLQFPVIRQLHARSLLFPAAALLAVVAVLLHGALRRQPVQEAAALDVSPPSVEAAPLRADLEKTPLTYLSDYWRQLGEKSRDKLVPIGPDGTPGVVVAQGLALTSIDADSPTRGQKRLGVDGELGLALFELPEPSSPAPFVLADSASLKPASYVASVSLGLDQRVQIIPGYVVSSPPGTESFELSIDFPDSIRVAAIVNLDGRLAGLGVSAGGRLRLIPANSLPSIVERLRAGGPCRSIQVGDIGDEVRAALGTGSGVLVESVLREAFVPEPSIRAGDVLLSWKGSAVAGSGDFHRLYAATEPDSRVRYVVLRDLRKVFGTITMPGLDCRPAAKQPLAFPALGVTLEWKPSEPSARVLEVAEDSPAARAGLLPGDSILRAAGRNVSRANAQSLFGSFDRRRSPMVLTADRRGRVMLLALSPPVP